MNTPRNHINPEDPKWTAYVLGELDEVERAEIDRLLETSEEARVLVEELTAATLALKEELVPLEGLTMTPEQRAAVQGAAAPSPRRWLPAVPAKWGLGLAAAAVLAMAVWVGRTPTLPAEVSDVALLQKADDLKTKQDSAGGIPYANDAGSPGAEVLPAEERERLNSVTRERLRIEPAQVAAGIAPAEESAVGPRADAPADEKDTDLALLRLQQEQVLRKAQNEVELADSSARNSTTVRDGLSALDNRERGQVAENQVAVAPAQQPLAPSAASVGEVLPPTPTLSSAGGRGGRGGGAVGPGVGGGVLGGILTEANKRPAGAPPPPPPAPPPPPPPGTATSTFLYRFSPDRVVVAPNAEAYNQIVDNPFIRTSQENLATLSIDVDTASYANVRRFLNQNQLPPRDAVRIEELINYFSYDYAQPSGNTPIATNMEVAAAPWNPQNRLLRIGIKAREIDSRRRPPSNLVFLIDVSGSMNSPEKLPLVKSGLRMLADQLGENDMISIVVYAGSSGLVLPPTSGARKEIIRQSIDRLEAGGSTNGASGIQLAYNQATANFIRNGVNRVILMTDGDFNVGITNQSDLTRLIQDRARSGVFLSVLGFGTGNLKDSTLERLADEGNGHYAYIDNLNEARKVLVEEMGSTLVTVAKDVKIQVDFNPARVEAYRLIGYENRVLRTEDFNNDAKDAGDMGAGHTVTALFEIVPKGGSVPGPSIDPSKYRDQRSDDAPVARANAGTSSNEMLTLRVRYKQPDSDTSSRDMDVPLIDRGQNFNRASQDFRFAAAVAEFGMILRDSPYRGSARMSSVLDIVEGSLGPDRNGYRREFVSLVEKARALGR